MKDIEAWDMLHGNKCEAKSLSEVIKEMGFSKESFLIVHRDGPELKVYDTINPSTGLPQENPNLSFGGRNPKVGGMTDFEAIDKKMMDYSSQNRGGQLINGMTGSNNGIYAAMANNGSEFIITKNQEIIKELQRQLGFVADGLSVPLSNGGIIMDPQMAAKWRGVEILAKREANNEEKGNSFRPKTVKSPFRNEYGELTPEYKNFRADRLNVSQTKMSQNMQYSGR